MTKQQTTQNNRPVSPHLSIYKPQITSMLSIMHRLTGVALFFGIIILCWWTFFSAYGCGNCLHALLGSPVIQGVLILWSAALYYHLFNGIRHLYWDTGRGFKLCAVHASGWFVLLLTLLATGLTWSVVLGYIHL